MDTSAYLSRQGWLGAGHALHPTGRGIKKPLLVSKKSNVLGIGKRQHDAHADQWWARAFDNSLKGLDIEKDDITGQTETVKSGALGALDMMKAGGGKWLTNGGLYGAFVKGEGLSGTLIPESGKRVAEAAICKNGGKRKREDDGDDAKVEKHACREERKTDETREVDMEEIAQVHPAPSDKAGRLSKEERRKMRERKLADSSWCHSNVDAGGRKDSTPSSLLRKKRRKNGTEQKPLSSGNYQEVASHPAVVTANTHAIITSPVVEQHRATGRQRRNTRRVKGAERVRKKSQSSGPVGVDLPVTEVKTEPDRPR
ncbi:hypothetical protein MMC24_004935 [Lignoscripta atroalba]|nr:hypothetical protein [Lignoscripta atroalba]